MKHQVELIHLKNGADGLLIDVPGANVMTFDISFRAGDYLSPPGKMDTAHVMEHLVFGANKEFKKSSKFSQEFCKNGAYNNAYTAEFKAEIANIREELKSRTNNYDTELSLALEHALGFVPLTYKVRVKQLDAVKLKDIREHYLKTHFTRNCRFIIAGRIAPYRKAIINRLENLQIHKGRRRLDLPSETPRSLGKPLVMFHKGIDNLYYRWESAMPVVLDETERESLRCLQDLLFNTFHSRIFGIARERGLLYGLSANFYRTRDHHVWYVQGQVLPQNIRPLFDLILKQISEVCAAKISCQEVEAVKLFALGTLGIHRTLNSMIT